ncbi:SMI1/KNR4 family protein [Gimesia maris]|uniref:SMI1/KNR4 family protein n=1 Tax=Gimesia maris TaxID=122 RepID=UPI0024200CFD|nr:SMI1/KNR4 family protein [Gimesia maris]|tara:strand:- start:561 stop:1019 length:459 start_codon:yes stop_codon:yes gene_type:complete
MTAFDDDLWAKVLANEDTKLNSPASLEDITSFEETHQFALPPSHREFLLRGNGGTVGYVRLFGVALPNALDLDQQVSEMRQDLEEMANGPVIPFASDWGGSYFCYDLRKPGADGELPVLYWDHEYSEEPEDLPMVCSGFALNFVEFIQKVIS